MSYRSCPARSGTLAESSTKLHYGAMQARERCGAKPQAGDGDSYGLSSTIYLGLEPDSTCENSIMA